MALADIAASGVGIQSVGAVKTARCGIAIGDAGSDVLSLAGSIEADK